MSASLSRLRPEATLTIALVVFFVSFVLSLVFQPDWLIRIVGSIPILAAGIAVVLNYNHWAEGLPIRLFGFLFVSCGLLGITLGLLATHDPTLENLDNALFNLAAAAGFIGVVGSLVAAQYYRSAGAWRRRGHAGVLQLIEILEQGNYSGSRATAARILGELGDTSTVKPLVAALSDNSSIVRAGAAQALGNLGDPQALPALTQLQQHDTGVDAKGHPIKEIAAQAVAQIQARQHIHSDTGGMTND